jgi:hypothetical protein
VSGRGEGPLAEAIDMLVDEDPIRLREALYAVLTVLDTAPAGWVSPSAVRDAISREVLR